MFVYNSIRRKKHNICIYIKPNSEANTSIRPKDFMQCVNKFSSEQDFLKFFKSYFNAAVRNNQFCKLSDRMKEDQFDINVKYNGKAETGAVNSTTHRCVYNVVINKRRTASYYGYHIYIYFIPKDEIVSCVQNNNNFVVELKKADVVAIGRTQQPIERRINVDKTMQPIKAKAPKGCEFVYKIEAENPYYVESFEEAEWVKQKQHYDYKEVLVANVAGVLYELLAPANLVEVDIHDYSENHIFKTKTAIPKGFKHQKYTVNGSQIVYSNMLIDDAVEGVYDTVGTYAGKLIVVIHRSFLGETREVIYTEDPEEMEDYKSKFMNRQKI